MARFGQVVTAMVTPFDADGALDLDAVATLARWLIDHGSEGLVVAGTTGESPTLKPDETIELARAVRDAVSVPVVLGTGSNDTDHAIGLTARAADLGMDGVLLVTPYYNRPSQEGLYRHFSAVAAATDLPALLYDIPVRTGRKIDTHTMVRLLNDVDNIVGVKDAAGDVAETARLIARAPAGTEVYSGDDALTLPLLSVGAVGVVSVASHWGAPWFARMIACHAKGDVDGARQANAALLDSYDFESTIEAPNPVPTKAMLGVLGVEVGECRPPMGPTPDGLADRARAVAAALDLL